MTGLRLLLSTFMVACATVALPQTVINSGTFSGSESNRPAAALPLRNLHIEVRQVEQDDAAREGLTAAGSVRLQAGQSSAAVDIRAQSQQSSRSGTAQQQALVLNGRRVSIMLGQAVPLRLLRTIWSNGVWRTVPGTLWLQAGSGFDALPRWDGGDLVELELSASQSRGAQVGGGVDHASASTTLMLPLGEWMTMAQSDQDQDSQQSGLSHLERSSTRKHLKVQVRVTVR